MGKKHILISGERGAGKSTLIQRLLLAARRPAYGFVTKRLPPDETGFHPIYIHPAWQRREVWECGDENLVGTCDTKVHNVNLSVFDTLGARYIRAAKPGGIIVMDELGFMEAEAHAFVSAVFDALNGEIPVLAAVKARHDVPFLDVVRGHANAAVYEINEKNRDALFETLSRLIGSLSGSRAALLLAQHDGDEV